MQLISLNIWGGHVCQSLLEFVSRFREVDIFCFQEVYHRAPKKTSNDDRPVNLNIFADLQTVLPKHQAFFRPVVNVLEEDDVIIHTNPDYPGLGPTHSRNLQWILCRTDHQICSIRLLEANLQNLIKTHDIRSTRTGLYSKEEKYADYVLISPEIIVNSFTVLADEISDHAPLFLDYKIAS